MRKKVCAEFVIIIGASLILVVFSIFMIHRKNNTGKMLLGVTLSLLAFSVISVFCIKPFYDEIAYIIILISTCLISYHSVDVVDFGFIGALSTTINALTTVALLTSNIIFSGIIAEAQFAFNLMTLPFLILGAIMSCRASYKLYLSPNHPSTPAPDPDQPEKADGSDSKSAVNQSEKPYAPMFFALFWSTLWIPIYMYFKRKKK